MKSDLFYAAGSIVPGEIRNSEEIVADKEAQIQSAEASARRDVLMCVSIVSMIATIVLGIATSVVWNNYYYYRYEEKKVKAFLLTRQIEGVTRIAVSGESETLKDSTSRFLRHLRFNDSLDAMNNEISYDKLLSPYDRLKE